MSYDDLFNSWVRSELHPEPLLSVRQSGRQVCNGRLLSGRPGLSFHPVPARARPALTQTNQGDSEMTKTSTRGPALVTEMPGAAKSRRARQTAKGEGKTPKLTVVKPPADEPTPARFGVVRDGRKWFVTEEGAAQAEPFKTRLLAQTEADAQAASFGVAGTAAAPKAPEAPAELTGEAIAKMSRTERLVIAKTEMEALRAYRTDGRPVEPGMGPKTPVLDWMTDPDSKPAVARKASGEPKAPARTPEQDQMVVELISAGRACEPPVSWGKIAEQIEAQAIPTNRGGKWYDTTVSDLAKKLNLFTAQPAS